MCICVHTSLCDCLHDAYAQRQSITSVNLYTFICAHSTGVIASQRTVWWEKNKRARIYNSLMFLLGNLMTLFRRFDATANRFCFHINGYIYISNYSQSHIRWQSFTHKPIYTSISHYVRAFICTIIASVRRTDEHAVLFISYYYLLVFVASSLSLSLHLYFFFSLLLVRLLSFLAMTLSHWFIRPTSQPRLLRFRVK